MTDTSIIEQQIKALSEVVYKNKETTERLESNWDKDRKDFSQFENRLGHLEVEQKSLKETINTLPGVINDKMKGVIDPLKREIDDFKSVIQNKKMVAVDAKEVKKQTKSWWKLW